MDTASLAFTAVFCTLLVLGLLTRTVLASRQIRHVARHRNQVPAPFDATIPLDAHRKAADYTIAKTRLGLVDTAFEAAMLIAWTLLGGLHWLNQALLGWLGGGMVQQLALIAGFMTRWAALAALPIMIGAIIPHAANGYSFSNPGGGWEYPVFWAVTLVAQAIFGDGAYAVGNPFRRKA